MTSSLFIKPLTAYDIKAARQVRNRNKGCTNKCLLPSKCTSLHFLTIFHKCHSWLLVSENP